jgi:hypothetical protein
MPWIAPNVGYVDNVGRLRCCDCAEERHRDRAVAGDQWFGADDVCESCGHQLVHLTSKDYVHVSFQASAPDFKRPVIAPPLVPTVEPPRQVRGMGRAPHPWAMPNKRNAGLGFGS